jgi:hypothetical protein
MHRALHQAARMRRAAARSGGALRIITSAQQLDEYVAEREACMSAPSPRTVGGVTSPRCNYTAALLGVEGAHALQRSRSAADGVARLHAAGVRLLGLHHFADNEAGGSVHGMGRGGLTQWGAEVIAELEAKGMLLDLAHSSMPVIRDALAIVSKPCL